jgi:hypothetical protein
MKERGTGNLGSRREKFDACTGQTPPNHLVFSKNPEFGGANQHISIPEQIGRAIIRSVRRISVNMYWSE